MEEKRKFVRLESPIGITYRILTNPPIENQSVSKNISGGGIRVILKEKMLPDSALEVKINISENDTAVSALGEIVWQEEMVMGTDVCYETGIKFTKIAAEDRDKITHYIYKVLSKRIKNPEED